jgi:hypothetical protein
MIFGKKRELPLPAPDYVYDSISERTKFLESLKIIKEEVAAKGGASADPELPELPELPDEKGMPELPELPDEGPEEEPRAPMPKIMPKQKTAGVPETAEKRPLFIKVEKFREMLASVETIEKKIREMSAVMQKLKDIRAREEETMAQWETEIQELKMRLEVIEKTLSQVET